MCKSATKIFYENNKGEKKREGGIERLENELLIKNFRDFRRDHSPQEMGRSPMWGS